MPDHAHLNEIVIRPCPGKEGAEIKTVEFTDGEKLRTTVTFNSSDFEVHSSWTYSTNKQKLIAIGFSHLRADQILDALGLV